MRRWASAGWILATLASCSSCRGPAAADDATVGSDNARADYFPFDVVLPDAPPPPPDLRCGRPGRPLSEQPPWADCTLRITPTPVTPTPLPACGPGRFVLDYPLNSTEGICVHDGWIYAGRGFSRRVRLSDGRVETLTRALEQSDLAGTWGCNAEGLVFSAFHAQSRTVSLAHFSTLDRPGQVRWHQTLRIPDRPEGILGGVYETRASDVFSFFLFEDQSPAYFYVASPTGENPRRLDLGVGHINSNFVLDGRYMTYTSDWDIHLYDHVTGRDENLTQTDSVWEQFSAIDGDRVVYIDHRTRDPADYNNANVWLLDLRTRQRTAITSQPAQPASQRFHPAIHGDWILWEDCRDQPEPNPGIRTCGYRNLYGYNLRTRREVALAPGTALSGYPFLVDDKVYYACALTRSSRVGTYVMDLPRD